MMNASSDPVVPLSGFHHLILIGSWASPFVLRARIALNLKGLNYEFIQEKLGIGAEKSHLLLKYNPVYKKIPVLIHNGSPICESMIIVNYIHDVFSSTDDAPEFLPKDAYRRALHRFWAVYLDDKWFKSFMEMMKTDGEEERKVALEQTLMLQEPLEEALEKLAGERKVFYSGDDIGYLDIAVGSFLAWMRVAGELFAGDVHTFLDPARFPRLSKWAESFCSHDAVKGVMPETSKLMAYFLSKPKGSNSKPDQNAE